MNIATCHHSEAQIQQNVQHCEFEAAGWALGIYSCY